MAYMYIGGCYSFPPEETEIKSLLEVRVAEKVDQSDNHIIPADDERRLCFVYPVAYGTLISILRDGVDEILPSFISTYISMDITPANPTGDGYSVYTLGAFVDNVTGANTYTYIFDGVPLPPVYPWADIPTIVYQPDYHGVVYSRSPIIYAFRGLNMRYTYNVNVYVTTGSTAGLIEPYASIVRKPDVLSGITIDLSTMYHNILESDIEYYSENMIYAIVKLMEYDENNVLRTVTSTDVAKVTLGYTFYVNPLAGTFNYNEGIYAPIQVDWMMNSNQNNVPYYIPNYGYGRFIYNWKKATGTNDKWRILYTNLSGITVAITPGFDPINVAADEIQTIYCGYYDLINYWGVTSLDITKPIYVQTLIGTDVSYNFPLYPVSCNGNDVINIQFMNKWGVWERFFCYGRVDTALDITYDIYNYNNVSYTNMSYDSLGGSYHKRNFQGKRKMIVNTGWLQEVFNVKIEELLLSEHVLYEPYIGGAVPYIITDKEVKYKTDKYDKMINYTFTLEQAFDAINNVI